ncbi:major facilitator superfamily domain-containing protein [Syncephalis fuscata]|nr:major facilitator superfamily domain-containing protein [Syncephalis fuscata]
MVIPRRQLPKTNRKRPQDLGFNFQRWMILLASFLVQFPMGLAFAWSVFNQPVDGYIYNNVQEGRAPLTYTIMFGLNGLADCIAGPWVERLGPRKVLIIGTLFYITGFPISALGIYYKYIGLVYFGQGILAGSGAGICFMVPTTIVQKWFPDYRGVSSGIAIASLGIGNLVHSQITLPVIDLLGIPWTLIAYGAVHLILLSIGTFITRIPPPDFTVKGMNSDGIPTGDAGQSQPVDEVGQTTASAPTRIKYTPLEMLGDREYHLVIASRLSNIVIDVFQKSDNIASAAVSVDGAFSALGSIIVPLISDFIGRKSIFVGTSLIQITCVVLMIIFLQYSNLWGFLVAKWFVTSCVDGECSTLPSMLAELYGNTNVSTGYGVLFAGWGIMGISGGFIFAAIYDHLIDSKQYTAADPMVYIINIYWMLAVCCVGMVVLCFLRMSVRDRLLLPVPGQLFRIQLGKRLLRVSTRRGIELLSSEDEEREWTAFWSTQTIPASGNSAKNYEISNI